MDQHRAPIYERLQEYAKRKPSSFHIPGHKRRAFSSESWLKDWFMVDVTEITGMDDLHAPEEMILEAEQLAAACFGADRSFLLVGGSTSGNLALLLSVCEPGDVVLVDRHAHKSVLHGLMLARAKAVFLPVELDAVSGIPIGTNRAAVEKAIEQYPNAKALILTCPNYYGYGPDIRAIASLLRDTSIPLMVDEAHGVHFGFHDDLPLSAVRLGADAVVQSAHKMGGGLTMGAFLHLRSDRIDPSKVRQALSMVQTSSPSYPILASLDVFRREWATNGQRVIQQGLDAVRAFRESVKALPRFAVANLQDQIRSHKNVQKRTIDPFKIYLYDRTGELNGYALQARLEQNDCMIEMADPRGVLLVFTYASTVEDALQLHAALQDIAGEPGTATRDPQANVSGNALKYEPILAEGIPEAGKGSNTAGNEIHISDPVDLADWQRTQDTELVQLEQAKGRRVAEMIIPYPPGIPLACKGEVLTEPVWRQALQLREAGARFQGTEDGKLAVVRVIAEGE